MKKWIFPTCCIIVFLSCLFFASSNKSLVNAEKINDQQITNNEKDSEEVTYVSWDKLSKEGKCNRQIRILKNFLDPYIQEAVNEYYGEHRQYTNMEILSIEPVPTIYADILKVQVQTFVGPHKPPYGLDTITLYQDSSSMVEVQDFIHKDIDID